MRDRTEVVAALLLCALLMATPFAPTWQLSLLTNAFSKAIVVIGLILLLRAGLVPFGHALFYCIGGYTAALATIWYGIRDVFLLLMAAALVTFVVGWVVGWLIRRYRGIFFAMLSMAFSMILYGVLLKAQTLGSSDGLSIPRPTIFGTSVVQFGAVAVVFGATCVILFITVIAAHRYTRTTLGALAPAIKDNEVRIEYLGYSPDRLIHGEFVVSAMLAGVAGCLVALSVGQVDPSMGYWTQSGEFVFVLILSGAGPLWAPVAAALLFELVHAVAYDIAPQFWRIILGSVLLLVILYLPNGLSSVVQTLKGGLRWKIARS